MKTLFTRLTKFILALALPGLLALLLSASAAAAPDTTPWFTVTSAADNNTADSQLTLREALLVAFDGTNNTYGLARPVTDTEKNLLSGCHFQGYEPDHWWIDSGCGLNASETIAFYLANCPCTIAPTTALPFVASGTTIDGYSGQPGASFNTSQNGFNANIMIRLYGGNVANAHGLDIGVNVTVKGLEIYNFDGAGIHASSGGDTITGDIIDTNAQDGIALYASGNHIGGNTLAARNAIYQNGWHGVEAFSGSTGNQIVNNLIGVPADNDNATGNTNSGISIYSSSNYISGNTIAYNGNTGILVLSGSQNNFYNNSFHDNGNLAVDLGNNGVTLNDSGDGDTGANDLQNFPVLTSAVTNGGTTTIKGTLNTSANTQSIQIDFYASGACDSSGYGEGATRLGYTTVATDANGNANISFVPASAVAAGKYITALTTKPGAGTSEFSKCFQVTNGGVPTPTPTPTGCNTKPAKPTLQTPKNNATVKKQVVTLKWNAAQCATTYKFIVKQDSAAGQPIEKSPALSVTNAKTKTLSKGHTYFWKVKACNSFGCKGSKMAQFTIQ